MREIWMHALQNEIASQVIQIYIRLVRISRCVLRWISVNGHSVVDI